MIVFKHKPKVQHEILKTSGLGCEQWLGCLGKQIRKLNINETLRLQMAVFLIYWPL